jgi:transcriptional regulator GlxA family with amidase domain
VSDGKVITAAGVGSAIDMALTPAAREAGEDEARALQRIIECGVLRPSAGSVRMPKGATAGEVVQSHRPAVDRVVAAGGVASVYGEAEAAA